MVSLVLTLVLFLFQFEAVSVTYIVGGGDSSVDTREVDNSSLLFLFSVCHLIQRQQFHRRQRKCTCQIEAAVRQGNLAEVSWGALSSDVNLITEAAPTSYVAQLRNICM